MRNLCSALLIALATVLSVGAAHATEGDDHSYLPPSMRPASNTQGRTDVAAQDTEKKTNGRKGGVVRTKYARKDNDVAKAVSRLFSFLR